MLYFLGLLLTGLVVGLLARLFKPGDDSMSMGKTILVGVTGALLASGIGRLFNWYQAGEAAGFIASTVGAIVVLFIYSSLTHRGDRLIHH